MKISEGQDTPLGNPGYTINRGSAVYPFFHKLSRGMAMMGGGMLVLLILLTCISVLGRGLNDMMHSDLAQGWMPGLADWVLALGVGPINGDFELTEAGVAFAIFAFLPLCQITGGHATVDIFTQKMPARVVTVLRMVTEVVFAAVLILIAAQLWDGMQSKLRSGQTTQLIEFPVWWAYALSMLGAAMAAVVASYLAVMRVVEVATGRTLLPDDLGADH